MQKSDQNLFLLAALAALGVWWITRQKTEPTPLMPSATVPSYYASTDLSDVYL